MSEEYIRRLRDYASANECPLTCSCGQCAQCDAMHLPPAVAVTIADALARKEAEIIEQRAIELAREGK
jgi:hypothetical protein